MFAATQWRWPNTVNSAGCFAVSALALIAAPVDGAEWSVESAVSGRAVYDDNIALTSTPHTSVFGAAPAGTVTFRYDTEVATISGAGTLDAQRYSGDSELDT